VRWHTSYAPAGKRLVAYAVDAAIAMVLFDMQQFQVAFVEVALEMSLTGKSSDDMSSAGTVVAVAAWVLTTWIYQVVPVHSVWQATPGMRTAGLFIVNLDGRRMSIGRATLRHFAKPLSYVLGLGLMMQLFTARRQTLHDLLSRSVVLCRRAEDEVPAAGGPAVASLTRRAGAFAIDGALSLVILLASMLFAAMLNAGVEKARTGVVTDQMAPWSIWVAILGWLVAISVYHILALSSRLQATLGMLATGLFVTDVAGKPLAVGSATARHLLKSVSYFLGIGVLVQLLTARRQALHDLLSGSVVLRRQPASARQAPGSGLQAPGPI
jgi:uncharacterized RDD family membrane protein YckC